MSVCQLGVWVAQIERGRFESQWNVKVCHYGALGEVTPCLTCVTLSCQFLPIFPYVCSMWRWRKRWCNSAILSLASQGQNSVTKRRRKTLSLWCDELFPTLIDSIPSCNISPMKHTCRSQRLIQQKWVRFVFVRRPSVCSLFMFDLFSCPHSVFLSICLSHVIQKSEHWAWPYKLSTRWPAWTGREQPSTLVFRLQCKRTTWGIFITARWNKHSTFFF